MSTSDSDMFLGWAEAPTEAGPPEAVEQAEYEPESESSYESEPESFESGSEQTGQPKSEDQIVQEALAALGKTGEQQSRPEQQQLPKSETTGTLAQMLERPANQIDPAQFVEALRTERPEVFNSFFQQAVSNVDKFDPAQRDIVDIALQQRVTDVVAAKTGMHLNGDQIADALGLYCKMQLWGYDPIQLVEGLISQQNVVPPNVAANIAERSGLAPEDPLVTDIYNMLLDQQRSYESQLRPQFDPVAVDIITKLPNTNDDQKRTIATAVQGKLNTPAFQKLRDDFAGWMQEGKAENAERVRQQYVREVGKVINEVAGARQRASQPQRQQPVQRQRPARQTQPVRYQNEAEAVDRIARMGGQMLRAMKGDERR